MKPKERSCWITDNKPTSQDLLCSRFGYGHGPRFVNRTVASSDGQSIGLNLQDQKLRRYPRLHPGPIALTGFMGSGKSTIGRTLAHQLGWTFIDIDQQIETVHSRPASSLFHELGEAMFRAVEARITAECLALCCTVVALGGAAVDLPENQSLLTENYHGCLIFLDGEFEVLINRCLQEDNKQRATYRPLLHQPDKALARFLSRRTWNLANADLRIEVGSKSCEQSAKEIFEHLRAYKSS